MSVHNGGSAFPYHFYNEHGVLFHEAGMSLRDWLAGQALPAVVAAVSAGQHHVEFSVDRSIEQAIAQAAYKLADAMIAEGRRS